MDDHQSATSQDWEPKTLMLGSLDPSLNTLPSHHIFFMSIETIPFCFQIRHTLKHLQQFSLCEEKSKCAGLAPQEIGFGSTLLHSLQWLANGAVPSCTSRKECNKYDIAGAQCLFLIGRIVMIGPGGLLLVVPHLFALLVSVSWVGLQESK
jgi:hypothetical protein